MDAEPAITVDKLVPFRGTNLHQSTVNAFPQVEKFQAQPDDVLIVTYPKAGTTWLSEIMDMIYQSGDIERCSRDTTYYRVPFLELCPIGLPAGLELVAALPSPRLIRTHLAAYLIPESFWKSNCKIIYMARNAKDVAASFFFFMQTMKSYQSTNNWEEFLEQYMAGEVYYGSWYDHVIGWWEKRENLHILYLFYEDMKEDPMREIRNLVRFLEKDLGEEILEQIVHQTSFKAMKENPMANYRTIPNEIMDQNISPFMRKGVAGDWKNHFTVAQNERFDEQYTKKMEGIMLRFRSEIQLPSKQCA